jgi:hypothetical protein
MLSGTKKIITGVSIAFLSRYEVHITSALKLLAMYLIQKENCYIKFAITSITRFKTSFTS